MHQRVRELIEEDDFQRDLMEPLSGPLSGYDSREQDYVIRTFTELLWKVTKDGGTKRANGSKPPWWKDDSHEAAIFSHLSAWKHGVRFDPHSGTHPLVHLAWRALAAAYIDMNGKVDPAGEDNTPPF